MSFDTTKFQYSISVRRVNHTEFKSEEILYKEYPTSFTYLNRHGVRLLFLRKGTVGRFDFQTLLINVIAGSALVWFIFSLSIQFPFEFIYFILFIFLKLSKKKKKLSAVTYAVDWLAKYIMPQRAIYREYMIQPTPDFSGKKNILPNQ